MLLNLLWVESHVHPFKTQAVTLHLEIVIQKRTVIAMNAIIFRSVQISNVGDFTLKSTVPSVTQTIVEVLVQ